MGGHHFLAFFASVFLSVLLSACATKPSAESIIKSIPEPRAVKQCKIMLSINPKKQPRSSEQLVASSFELKRLEALVAKMDERSAKLKASKLRWHLAGGRAKSAEEALYIVSEEKRLEDYGNKHYPELARKHGLYGDVELMVSIMADGTLEDITISKTSGCEILDDHAYRTVKLSAPFKPFERGMKDEFDILTFTRTFFYTKENDTNAK